MLLCLASSLVTVVTGRQAGRRKFKFGDLKKNLYVSVFLVFKNASAFFEATQMLFFYL